MFLALGAGAWAAAIYHFVTHALFKSALFLGAGVMLHTLNNEHNIFKMGGMRKKFPYTFRAFMAASLTLAALPPLTISFNSKDLILNDVMASSVTWHGFWIAGIIGAFLTAAYSFRLLYIVFFGKMKTRPNRKPTSIMIVPLIILAFLAAVSGLPDLLTTLFGVKSLYEFLQTSMPENFIRQALPVKASLMQIFYAAVSLAAFGFTYLLYMRKHRLANLFTKTFIGHVLDMYLLAGFGFDWFYNIFIVHPYIWITRINKSDVMNWITKGNVYVFRRLNFLLSEIENGNLRWYVGGIAIGAMIFLGMVILL